MDEEVKRRAPAIMKLLSGIFRRAFPTIGLKTKEETLRAPIRTPISASLAPMLER